MTRWLFSKLHYTKSFSNPISLDLQCGVLRMKSTTHPNPLCPAIEEGDEVGLLPDWLTYHLWWSPPPLYNLWQIPFLCCEFMLVLLLKSLFQITCLLAYQFRRLYLLCMAWCTWKTQLSPILLILALQDVKSSIQFCACCGAPLRLMPLIYNQWLSTLPVLLSTFVQPLNDTSNLTTPWVCPQHERAIISDP